MLVSAKPLPEGFKPFELIIGVESVLDLKLLYHLFNTTANDLDTSSYPGRSLSNDERKDIDSRNTIHKLFRSVANEFERMESENENS